MAGDYAAFDPANPLAVVAVTARPMSDGFTDSVFVVVYDNADDQVPLGSEFGQATEIRGQPARLEAEDGRSTLWWEEDRFVISVMPRLRDTGLIRDIATAIRLGDEQPFDAGVLTFGGLPEGHDVLCQRRSALGYRCRTCTSKLVRAARNAGPARHHHRSHQ